MMSRQAYLPRCYKRNEIIVIFTCIVLEGGLTDAFGVEHDLSITYFMKSDFLKKKDKGKEIYTRLQFKAVSLLGRVGEMLVLGD